MVCPLVGGFRPFLAIGLAGTLPARWLEFNGLFHAFTIVGRHKASCLMSIGLHLRVLLLPLACVWKCDVCWPSLEGSPVLRLEFVDSTSI